MVKLRLDEYEKLKAMYRDANNTPVVLVGGVSLADSAWAAVQRYMDELGRKYGYDPKKHIINKEGEVIPVE